MRKCAISAGVVAGVLALVALATGAWLGLNGPSGWRVSSEQVVVENCPIVTMPNLAFELEIPPPVNLLEPVVSAVQVSAADVGSWGIVREESAADGLIGLEYCIVQGPPWTVERIKSGTRTTFADLPWIGSAVGEATLQIPTEESWIVAELPGDSVTFQWFVDADIRSGLARVAVGCGAGAIVFGTISLVCTMRRRTREVGTVEVSDV